MKRIAVILLLCACLSFPINTIACELMGLSFSERVSFHQTLSAFLRRGSRYPDGWGVAIYRDESATLFKEASKATESAFADFLINSQSLNGKLMIAHVRGVSVGGRAHKNTHPFIREWNGNEYVLAHNGTLEEFRSTLELSRFKPIGTTDSEYLFCYLLGRIANKGLAVWNQQSFKWLQEELHAINDIGTLNCVFSDGTHLFAYHDKTGSISLCYQALRAPHNKVYFQDLSKEIDLGGTYPDSAAGVIVATKPLTDAPWIKFTPGQLLVFKEGKQIFPEANVN